MGFAARLFNGNAEQTLYARVTPTIEQREFLQAQWNALAADLKSELAPLGFPISTWLQGSYKFGTLIKPVHKGEEYDVDVGIYFEWDSQTDAPPSPVQLRNWVQNRLLDYKTRNGDVKLVEEPPKERCSRVIYEKQFHIDTPTYHLDRRSDRRHLACLSGKWEESDPKALYKWFRGAVDGEDSEQLRRIVRYLKGWAAVAFRDAPESRPSSIVLTVLATEAFKSMVGSRFWGVADDDALIRVVAKIYARLQESKTITNPVDQTEDLNRISEDGWGGFLTHLTVLNDCAQAASESEDEASASLAWEGAFRFLMPLPEADEVVVEEASGYALMQLPEIQVQVFKTEGGELLATYSNEVPSVGADHYLVFSIQNRHVVPPFATIEWTVRNDGADADYIGDLGHTFGGIGMFSIGRPTRYIGKHYMDCVIRSNGTPFAVRRVPVFVKADRPALIAQQERKWMQLRSRRGRRR